VSTSPNLNRQSDVSKITAVWETWIASLRASDPNSLAALVTEDVVIVHGDGRCLCGKEELRADFTHGFGHFDLEQKISSADIVIRDKWAIEIGEIENTLTPFRSGAQIRSHLRTVIVFARQPDASWKIARILDLPD